MTRVTLWCPLVQDSQEVSVVVEEGGDEVGGEVHLPESLEKIMLYFSLLCLPCKDQL